MNGKFIETRTTVFRLFLRLQRGLRRFIVYRLARLSDDEARELIRVFYRSQFHRGVAAHEVAHWVGQLQSGLTLTALWRALQDSDEARTMRKRRLSKPKVSDGDFIISTFGTLLSRAPTARELSTWRDELQRRGASRDEIVIALFRQKEAEDDSAEWAHASGNGISTTVFGTANAINPERWAAARSEASHSPKKPSVPRGPSPPEFDQHSGVRVSIICSMYKGGAYINSYLNNITSQTCFSFCELIIIDASSPESEFDIIKPFCDRFKQIVYHRLNYRASIYEAWNIGAAMARGEYLTNANLDDCRRADSVALQMATLDAMPFVDVVYQDFYYSLDFALSFEEVAEIGVVSDLPIVTPSNLLELNSPHNAPMWRKRLHEEVGYFDASFKSAGDWEFWMRCAANEKVFFKLNDPHVVYYLNPEGMSTAVDGPGLAEGRSVMMRWGRRLLPRALVEDWSEFLVRCDATAPTDSEPETSRSDVLTSLLIELALANEGSKAQEGQHSVP